MILPARTPHVPFIAWRSLANRGSQISRAAAKNFPTPRRARVLLLIDFAERRKPSGILFLAAFLMPLTVLILNLQTAHSQVENQQPANNSGRSEAKVVVSERALALHRRSFVFDGHNDLPWMIREKGSRTFARIDIAKPQPTLHTDIARLRQGGVGAQFWSVYVPSNTAYDGTAHQMTLEQIEIVNAMVQKYPTVFETALTSQDVLRIQTAGRIASLIGVEGGHAIDNSIEKLRRLYQFGARYMTLTHSDTLDWADSCCDKAKSQGLSEFGREVVREMNRLGMLVDISHVSPDTMQDALDTSVAPVIFSHSSARAVADHPRNVPDEILRQMRADGGVVMVNFYSGFVVPASAKRSRVLAEQRRELRLKYGDDADGMKKALALLESQHPMLPGSVYDVADHVDHIVKVAGIDHVGIGSDYDGIDTVPRQIEDVSKYPVLTQVLLDRGYSESDLEKILNKNILRVMAAAEQVARSLHNSQRN